MKKGIDYIGLAHYWKVVVKHHPRGYGVGVLCKASGWKNGLMGLRKVLKKRTSSIPFVRVHGIWHDNHIFTEKDIKPAVSQAKKLAKITKKYPGITFYYSPWLEPYAEKKVQKQCLKACAKVLHPRVILVSGDKHYKNYWHEVHHSAALSNDPYIFGYDGLSMRDADINFWKHQHEDAEIMMGWTWKCNGKKDKDDTTGRLARRFKDNWVDKKEIEFIKNSL